MAPRRQKKGNQCATDGNSTDSDMPVARYKNPRQKRRLIKARTLASVHKPHEKNDGQKQKRPATIKLVTTRQTTNPSPDNTRPPPGCRLNPTDLWDESAFNLSSPRLVKPHPLKYIWSTFETSTDGDKVTKHHTPSCLPVAPADDIPKTMSIHPDRPGMRWTGAWAKAKLAVEVERYERVKAFWLFENDFGFLAGLDDKHEFVASVFARELDSPWVVGWLRELIGEEDMGKIMDASERIACSEADAGM